MKNKTFLANCALVLCAVIWGMNFIFQKQASQHLGAFTFISLRYYLGVLSLLPLFFYMRRRKALAALEAGEEVERWHGRRFWLASLGASLANWGGAVLVQIGLHVADATKAGFIESAYIALVPVLDLLLFRKKTSRRVWIGIAMAIVGLYLLCISDGFSLDVNDAAIMASTLCFALHILMWSRFSPHVDALPFMVVEFLCTGTLSGLVALFTESLTLADLTAAVVPLLFAGVLGVGVTYTIQIYAQRFTPASVAALLMSMEAVFSAVGGVIILHETLSVREWVGCRCPGAFLQRDIDFPHILPGDLDILPNARQPLLQIPIPQGLIDHGVADDGVVVAGLIVKDHVGVDLVVQLVEILLVVLVGGGLHHQPVEDVVHGHILLPGVVLGQHLLILETLLHGPQLGLGAVADGVLHHPALQHLTDPVHLPQILLAGLGYKGPPVGDHLHQPLIFQPQQRRTDGGAAGAGLPDDVILDDAVAGEHGFSYDLILHVMVYDILRLCLLHNFHSSSPCLCVSRRDKNAEHRYFNYAIIPQLSGRIYYFYGS